MRRANRTLAMVLVGVVVAVLAAPTLAAAAIKAKRVISSLSTPTAFTFGPGRVVWYVEKNNGRIRTNDLGTHADSLFATVPRIDSSGERGLLGIALDPKYPSKPFVYVYATRTASGHLRNQILRFRDSSGTGTNRTVIWSAPASSNPYHNGGHIAFGPDRMLYAVVGDAHDSANAQDRTHNDRGKVLRMTRTGRTPSNNPFGNRIFSYGLRNSFGFAFDPRTGRLWESENGPECNDELNRIGKGRNYGWGPHETCSGISPRDTNRDGPKPVMPKLWYTPPIAPTGVTFCQGCRLGAKNRGRLFFGAFNTGQIRRVTLNAKRLDVRGQHVVYTNGSGILSMERAPGGRIYFSDGSAIYRLVRS
jgi:aldose sugar dehydrogenase